MTKYCFLLTESDTFHSFFIYTVYRRAAVRSWWLAGEKDDKRELKT